MKRVLWPVLVLICMMSAIAAAGRTAGIEAALPPGATLVVLERADLTGDGRPELIAGYTLPRAGLPQTEGHAAVLEQTPAGGFRRFDLQGAWPGHYPPRFTVLDLTGDGRPELVEEVAGGGAWQMLRVFRREPQGYALLLEDPGLSHALWDADGDGTPEVVGRHRIGSQSEQELQRYRWDGEKFVAWHTAVWTYRGGRVTGERAPNLTGLTPLRAQAALLEAGLSLGTIAVIDSPAPPDRVIRQAPPPDVALSGPDRQVHIALGVGNTRFTAGQLPRVYEVTYQPGVGPGALAPAATTPGQLVAWRGWLEPLVRDVQQVVHARFLTGPAYLFELREPWPVCLGGRWEMVHWVGVGMAPPHRGLIYLAMANPRPGHLWPSFQAALYTKATGTPPPVPPKRPLAQFLQENRELDAFVTIWPESWLHAVQLRGIAPEGWPPPDPKPPLEGPRAPDPRFVPDPDHVLVTVVNGYVRRAVRRENVIAVEVAAEPGRVHRWPLPLTGFSRATDVVRVELNLPDHRTRTTFIALQAWRERTGTLDHPAPAAAPPTAVPARLTAD